MLIKLDCNKNPLTTLDVSLLTKLCYLDCSNCRLTVLDTSSNKKITTINSEGNPLKQEAEDAVQIAYEADDYVECKIRKVWYLIWKGKKEATAVWGNMEGPVLEIPSSVELNGVRYPVTQFDNRVNFDMSFLLNNRSRTLKSYEEIKLPDSVLNVTVSNLLTAKICKKINIPKHAKADLRIDIDKMTVEVPKDHDYYRLKDNFVYDKKDSTKIYYVLGASGDVRIPKGVKYVGSLLRNNNIKKLYLPSTLQTIGEGFARATGMKTMDLSKTKLKKLPVNSFRLAKLQKIKLPATLLEIDRNAFSNCELEKVIIPNKVKKIGVYAFGNCSKLKKVTLGRKVERIGRGAFEATAIRELTIPASVKSIRGGIFAGAKKLQKVTFMHRKKLPHFDKRDPITSYITGRDPKVTFYVKNQEMKSSLEKKLKEAKHTVNQPPYITKIRKWKISLDKSNTL